MPTVPEIAGATAFPKAVTVNARVGPGGYSAGASSLTLQSGQGAQFGVVSADSPVRVTCLRKVGDAELVLSVLQATGRTGDTLTGITAVEGTTAVALRPNDVVDCRFTPGVAAMHDQAINALEAVVADWQANGGPGGSGVDEEAREAAADAQAAADAAASTATSAASTADSAAGAASAAGTTAASASSAASTALANANLALARPKAGAGVLDLRNLAGGTVCAAEIQAAIDEVKLAQINAGAAWPTTIVLPGQVDPLLLDRTVFADLGRLTIQGEAGGNRAALKWNLASCRPVLHLGWDRTPAHDASASSIPATHRPSCTDRLDGTVTGRWGYRTFSGDTVYAGGANSRVTGLVAAFNALNSGPKGWESLTFLTIHVAVEDRRDDNNPRTLAAGGLFGLGDPQVGPSPWQVRAVDVNRVQVSFATDELGPGQWHIYEFSTGSTAGVQRVAIQIDLDGGAIQAFANKDGGPLVQLALTHVTSSIPFVSGSRFRENEERNFSLGWNSYGWDGGSNANYPADRAFYGFRLMSAPYYVDNGAGQPASPVSELHPDTDNERYFEAGRGSLSSDTICLIDFTPAPAAALAKGREIKVRHGGWDVQGGYDAAAYIVHPDMAVGRSPGQPAADVVVRDLGLVAGGDFGAALVMGNGLDLKLSDCTLEGGWHVIGNYGFASNYQHKFRNLKITGGTKAGICSQFGSIDCQDLSFGYQVRHAVLSYEGNFTLQNMFLAPGGSGLQDYLFKFRQEASGGKVELRNLLLDYEGGSPGAEGGPSIAVVSVENNAFFFSADVTIDGVGFGSLAPDSTVLELLSTHVSPGVPARFSVKNVGSAGFPFKSMVRVYGNMWSGTVEQDRATAADHPDPVEAPEGVAGGVTAVETGHVGPPATRGWVKGSGSVRNLAPAPGQFGRWTATRTGAYGTDTPPAWIGTERAEYGDHGKTWLSAYAIDHARGTATLSGDLAASETTRGILCLPLRNRLLNILLRGASDAAPVVKAALSSWRPRASGAISELSGGGYARVDVPGASWGPSGSAYQLGTPFTFPTPTGTWKPVLGIPLVDQTTGQTLAILPANGKAYTSGDAAPSVTAAAFTPYPLDSPRGFLTDAARLAAFAHFFGGAAWLPISETPGGGALKPASPVVSGSGLGPHLVSGWIFREGSGSSSTGYGSAAHNFTWSAAPSWATGGYGAPGVVLTQAGRASDAGLPSGSAPWSLSLGITTTITGDYVTIYSSGTQSTGQRRAVYLRNGHFVFDGWSMLLEGSRTVNDGQPHQLQITYDGTTLTMRTDGFADGSAALGLNWTANTAGNQCVGAEVEGSPVRPYTQLLDYLMIYDLALDGTQLAADLANPFAPLGGVLSEGTGWYLGLSRSQAAADGTVDEPDTADGYARVHLGALAFAAAADGESYNLNEITFPDPTGDWRRIRSCFLADAPEGGTVLYPLNLTTPISLGPDDPEPTFAPGALWIAA